MIEGLVAITGSRTFVSSNSAATIGIPEDKFVRLHLLIPLYHFNLGRHYGLVVPDSYNSGFQKENHC